MGGRGASAGSSKTLSTGNAVTKFDSMISKLNNNNSGITVTTKRWQKNNMDRVYVNTYWTIRQGRERKNATVRLFRFRE